MKKKEKKDQSIHQTFSFTEQARTQLQNIQIGIINAQASMDGLQIYKNVILEQEYKRLGIDGEPKLGFNKSIRYNLAENKILHTSEPIPKDLTKKSN